MKNMYVSPTITLIEPQSDPVMNTTSVTTVAGVDNLSEGGTDDGTAEPQGKHFNIWDIGE